MLRVVVEPARLLAEGNDLLSVVLTPAGFSLGPPKIRRGSGGGAAMAIWTKGEQSIELHLRQRLGIVEYAWGQEQFSHVQICDALACEHEYPGFSGEPLDAFRRLAADLARNPLAKLLGPDHREVREAARAWRPPMRVLP